MSVDLLLLCSLISYGVVEAASMLKANEVVGDTDIDDQNATSFLGAEIIAESLKPVSEGKFH